MAYHFSLLPWDIDRLTIGEFHQFSGVVDEMAKQNREREKAEQREAKGLTRKR